MNKKRFLKYVIILSGSLLVLLIVTIITFEVTSQPKFCANCHEISPLVTSWQQSSHNGVSCLKCHAEPGFAGYVNRKIGGLREVYLHTTGQIPENFSVRLNPQNCINCHNGSQNFPGAPNIYDPNRKGRTFFGHQLHISMGQTCMQCHKAVVHGVSPRDPANNTTTINYHPICGSCHAVRPGDARVDDANSWPFQNSCMKCHPSDPRKR